MLTRGVLRASVAPSSNVPIVLRVSGGASILRELSHEGLTVAIEDAIRLNVSAITLSIFVGSEGERQTLLNLAKLVDLGEKYGIPVLAVTAVGKEMTRDARYLGLCCRIAAEIGAHFVKTYYCEGFDEVVRATPVPLIIAGGKKTDERTAIELAANAMRAGAAGVDMGRNVFQSMTRGDDSGRARRRARWCDRCRGVRDLRTGEVPELAMRVAVYYSNRDVRVEDRPRPTAGPGELVFRVMASGVCGSDVMEWYRLAKAPVVLGHEVAGEVVEFGAGLAGFAAGDRIVTTHHVPCNECRYCLAGSTLSATRSTTSFDPGASRSSCASPRRTSREPPSPSPIT
jgi:hypothetical protein